MSEETVEFTRKELEVLTGMIATGKTAEAQGFLISKAAMLKKRFKLEYSWEARS